MSSAKLARVVEVMHVVAADCAADATAIDGRPFDGRNVAECLGQMLAQIAACANAIAAVATELGGLDNADHSRAVR